MADELKEAEEIAQSEAEAATATEEEQPPVEASEPEDATPADDDAGAPRTKGAERRIGQLTRKYRNAERENERLKARLDALEERIGPEPTPARPKREDFDSTEDYEDALFDWRDASKSPQSQPEQTASVDIADNPVVIELETELNAINPDAAMTVLDDEWPCSPSMTEYIMSSENRAALAYHLATHIDVADKISKMSPILAARELTKVEGELSSKTNPSAQSSTNTPPPPADTGRATGATGTVDPDKMSTSQWLEWRNRQLEGRAQ